MRESSRDLRVKRCLLEHSKLAYICTPTGVSSAWACLLSQSRRRLARESDRGVTLSQYPSPPPSLSRSLALSLSRSLALSHAHAPSCTLHTRKHENTHSTGTDTHTRTAQDNIIYQRESPSTMPRRIPSCTPLMYRPVPPTCKTAQLLYRGITHIAIRVQLQRFSRSPRLHAGRDRHRRGPQACTPGVHALLPHRLRALTGSHRRELNASARACVLRDAAKRGALKQALSAG